MQHETQTAFANFFYRVFPTFLPLLYMSSFWQKVEQKDASPPPPEEEEKQMQ
jgi:hypothetical protein